MAVLKNSAKIIDYGKLAHDLKGPLNSIKGLLYIALSEVDSEDAQKYLTLMEHYQQLLYYKINDLLNRLQFPEKHLTLDFLEQSHIFESIRQPLSGLIRRERTGNPTREHRIPFSNKGARLDRLNKILDGLQKTMSKNNHDDSDHLDMQILTRNIKGSLNSIEVLLEIAISETENETARNYFGLIEKSRKNLLIRVDETLKRMHGNDSITISKIDFNELINNVWFTLQYMDGFSDIRFNIVVKNKRLFYSDAQAVSSIVQNLVENAIKYRKRDTSVHKLKVTVQDAAGGVILKISDNGVGIRKELTSSVFSFGVRGKNTPEEGHGIGLSLVKQLVHQLGGEISMKSINNLGTSFRLFIPSSMHSIK
jgi:signal transduction histidine kinase